MSKQLVVKQVIVTFYLLFAVSLVSAEENFAQQVFDTHQNRQPLPHLSQSAADTEIENAYHLQQAYVRLREQQEDIFGYKAGLTSIAGQQKFAVKQALSGVLFSSGKVTSADSILLADAGKLMLETEIGFILAKPITRQISSQKELADYIQAVVPVIELPDLYFNNPKQISGIDLIATNVASHQFLIGKPIPISAIPDLNLIHTQLSLNQQIVMQGTATDALGDQWQALSWLINHLLQQGYELSANNLLITGALGKMLAAEQGVYHADFGQLGKLDFEIK